MHCTGESYTDINYMNEKPVTKQPRESKQDPENGLQYRKEN